MDKVCVKIKFSGLTLTIHQYLIVFQPNSTQINMVTFISDPSKEGTYYPDQKSTKDVSQEELLHSFQDFYLSILNNLLIAFAQAHAMMPHLGIGAGMGVEVSLLIRILTKARLIRSPPGY
jgi:hypothetical protein